MSEDLRIEYRSPAELKPRKRNARTHSKKQIRQIIESIKAFGFNNPVLIDDNDVIVAGHGRVRAARELGLKQVPVIRLSGLTEEQIRAYAIAENRLGELAGWDKELLAIELEELFEIAPAAGFDVTATGFEIPTIDVMIQGRKPAAEAADKLPVIDSGPPVTCRGDLWQLGLHRLLCGDATDPADVERVLAGRRADMVFIDPPYNVPIAGHVSGLGKVRHEEFATASGEMSRPQFTAFLKGVFEILALCTESGSIHFVCMDWRHLPELFEAAEAVYDETKNLCVWDKMNGGMGGLYRSQHELIMVLKSGRAKHTNNIELGRHGRYRTNVWSYPGVNSFGAGRDEALAMHPTVKPIALVADAILDCSKRGGVVLDVFGGSGTSALAAERTGRVARLVEMEPKFVDVTLERWLDVTGIEPVLAATGETYTHVKRMRRFEADLGAA
jgi:DNA modification methylase